MNRINPRHTLHVLEFIIVRHEWDSVCFKSQHFVVQMHDIQWPKCITDMDTLDTNNN